MTRPAYERKPYRQELPVNIVGCGTDVDRSYIILNDTVLYPEGGGQPADHGSLLHRSIDDVQYAADGIRHYLSPGGPQVNIGMNGTLRLDWQRRYDHMQQHTAQHLLSALAANLFGWETTSFHLGSEQSDIEVNVRSLQPGELEQLEEAVANQIGRARPVQVRYVEPDELITLGVRTRRLPTLHTGSVRLVEIEGVDLNTCGGTHLNSTAEVGAFVLLNTCPMRGGTRLLWIAGRRVRQRLSEQEKRAAALRQILDTGDVHIEETVLARLKELKARGRTQRLLEGQLATILAESLSQTEGRACDLHIAWASPELLHSIARHFAAEQGARTAFLTSGAESCFHFLIVATEDNPMDLQGLGNQVASLLGGRGGGHQSLFQGKVTSLDRRDDAMALVKAKTSS